ncbi:MAG TPA: cell division protein ZapE [Micavibrio sp.]|nr:cell division protein ZapE [Micavibrio sp.]
MSELLKKYEGEVAAGHLKKDERQRKAAEAFDRLHDELTQKKPLFARRKKIQGVYIHGGVGRGKSMLMDMFFNSLPPAMPKRRVHFHEFMIETHDWLHERRAGKAVDNLLPQYARHVAANAAVLCFDEFHVTDVADAMILSRLFAALLDYDVVVAATSNWPPDRLYEGGLQRQRFLPFIALIKERLQVVFLDSDTDYRGEVVQDLETYLHPLNADTKAKADKFFRQLSGGELERVENVYVKGRDIPVQAADGVARFTFAQLCEQPHGAEDYLTIAQKFHTVFLENIPRLTYDRNNETKRLMTLVDVMYNARRRMVFTAEAAPEKLYSGDRYNFEFDRTISRLREMQSSAYTEI